VASAAESVARDPLEGAWVPIDARLGARRLPVGELRVRYLLLECGGYGIIDRSNHVVDGGGYRVNEAAATLDLVGHAGPCAGRTLLAIYALHGDELTVCYDLEGGTRPSDMLQRERLLLRITYTRAVIPLT
jgi:uncharacterized protein (TIGR03067 family)